MSAVLRANGKKGENPDNHELKKDRSVEKFSAENRQNIGGGSFCLRASKESVQARERIK